jgi:predicted MFS family arabinose efflux permease
MALPNAFRRLMWSNLAAQAAEQTSLAAAPLIAVLALGAGAGQTGLLAAVQSLPFLLLSLPAGVLADRTSKRRLMAAAELIRAAALLSLPALLWAGQLSLTALALVGALAATGTVAYNVAAPAMLPLLVPRDALTRANTRLELVRSIAFAAGPALAGILVAASGGGVAFALAAVLSVSAALLLMGLPDHAPTGAPRGGRLSDVMEGLRFVRHEPLLRPVLLTAVAWNLGWFVLQGVYVPFAVTILGLDAAAIGITLASYGVGMVAGALLAPLLARRVAFGTLVAIGPMCSVAASLAMGATLALPGITLPVLAFFLFGASSIVWTIAQTTLRQVITPVAMLGRVSALMMMATTGARPLGAALGGLVGEHVGLGSAVWLSAAGFAVQAAIILRSPVPRLRALPQPAA